jgi:hypothetical protein
MEPPFRREIAEGFVLWTVPALRIVQAPLVSPRMAMAPGEAGEILPPLVMVTGLVAVEKPMRFCGVV